MNRQKALQILARCKPELVSRFGVRQLSLFGSTARDDARPDSDVDVLVEFDGTANAQRFFGVQFLLEDELGHRVDLVTSKALRPQLQGYIFQDAIPV